MKKLVAILGMAVFAAPTLVSYASVSPSSSVEILQEEKKKEVDEENLPEAVQNTIDEKYKEMDVNIAYEVTKADDTKYYLVELISPEGKTKSVKIDPEGVIIG